MAAATGELHLYVLSENQVKHNDFRVHGFLFFFSLKMGKGIFIFSFLSLLNMSATMEEGKHCQVIENDINHT